MSTAVLRNLEFTPSSDGLTEVAWHKIESGGVAPFMVRVEQRIGARDFSEDPEVDLSTTGWGAPISNTRNLSHELAKSWRTVISIDQQQPHLLDVSGTHRVGTHRIKRIEAATQYIGEHITNLSQVAMIGHSRSVVEQYLAAMQRTLKGLEIPGVIDDLAPVGILARSKPKQRVMAVASKLLDVIEEGVFNEIPRAITRLPYHGLDEDVYDFFRYNAPNLLATVRLGVDATIDNVGPCIPYLDAKGVTNAVLVAEQDKIADKLDEVNTKALGIKKENFKMLRGEGAIHNVHLRRPREVADFHLSVIAGRKAAAAKRLAELNFGITQADIDHDLSHGVIEPPR